MIDEKDGYTGRVAMANTDLTEGAPGCGAPPRNCRPPNESVRRLRQCESMSGAIRKFFRVYPLTLVRVLD